ncbi:tripartite tricarboxylate transporter TctB family protein [Pseudooceanicola sp. 502str34]
MTDAPRTPPAAPDLETAPTPRRNWGALVFALVLAAALAFYAWSVMGVARGLTDYLLILPAAAIGVAATLWAGIADLAPLKGLAQVTRRPLREETKGIALLVLTGIYACLLPWIGFDVGTALFIALALIIQGERSWWRLALAAVPGAALMTWIFTDLLMVRLPVLLF